MTRLDGTKTPLHFVTYVLALGVTATLPFTLFAQNPSSEAVDRILARYSAVFSGEIGYSMRVSFPNKLINDEKGTVLFSGANWRLRTDVPIQDLISRSKITNKAALEDSKLLRGNLETEKISFGGKYLVYKRFPQSDGKLRHTATVNHQKALRDLNPFPPVFAGTIWDECTSQYISAQRHAAGMKPATTCNGVSCQVIEWQVTDADKYKAFHGTNDITANGGILRLYYAPQLGYALPRIEYAGPDGTLAGAYDSWGFTECAPGIFLPSRTRLQYHSKVGAGFTEEFHLTTIKRINEAIADSEFAVDLPIGTSVMDDRPGKYGVPFEVKEGGPIPRDTEDLLVGKWRGTWWGRNWQTATIVGILVGLSLAIMLWLRDRRFFGRAK